MVGRSNAWHIGCLLYFHCEGLLPWSGGLLHGTLAVCCVSTARACSHGRAVYCTARWLFAVFPLRGPVPMVGRSIAWHIGCLLCFHCEGLFPWSGGLLHGTLAVCCISTSRACSHGRAVYCMAHWLFAVFPLRGPVPMVGRSIERHIGCLLCFHCEGLLPWSVGLMHGTLAVCCISTARACSHGRSV